MAIKVGPQEVITTTGYWVGKPYGLKGEKGEKGQKGLDATTGQKGQKGDGGEVPSVTGALVTFCRKLSALQHPVVLEDIRLCMMQTLVFYLTEGC